MSVRDVVVLIPSHSLEDFPTEQTEQPAAGLLNAFAAAWHPRLIAATGQLPRWHRADDPPPPTPEMVVFAPEVCDGWLPHAWADEAREAGAVVVAGVHERSELIAQALAGLEPLELPQDLIADTLALGTCWLQIELLTRHMRNFGTVDEVRLQNRAVGAAKAIVSNDRETAEAHLRGAFEILQEARERFYPMECYLLDICLTIPDVIDDHFAAMLADPMPKNVLISGVDLEESLAKRPDLIEPLQAAIAAKRVTLIGGEQRDTALPLLPLSSVLSEFEQGMQTYQRLAGSSPTVWGRRRFGLAPGLPQILKHFGFHGALHIVLDDGIYPDAEYSRLRWRGSDGTDIDAYSRIPLAADSAVSYLRFPIRLSEAMDQDQIAAIAFARWPSVTAPWFEDLRRTQKYAPVLGKFITLDDLFHLAGNTPRLCQYQSKEYFAPFLLEHVARKKSDPISRYGDHTLRRRRFDAAEWCRSLAAVLTNRPVMDETASQLERQIDEAGPDRTEDAAVKQAEESLRPFEESAVDRLARLLVPGTQRPGDDAQPTGYVVINPYSFARTYREMINIDDGQASQDLIRNIDVPACGFASYPLVSVTPETSTKKPRRQVVDEGVIANDRWEVTLNRETGGIAQLRHPLKREQRLSQSLSFRFPRERRIPIAGTDDIAKTHYAASHCTGIRTLRDHGPIIEIESTGEIVDQLNKNVLAKFEQHVRLVRGKPTIELEISLTDVKVPDGDPWNNYFCCRFAWDDSAAAVTRCQLDAAQGFGNERFDTSDYIEIASETERLTIIPHGLPFHRKTGPRMLDSLLIVAGESQRTFRFTLAFDQPYPLEAAWDATGPLYQRPIYGPAPSVTSGWLFHLDSRQVQLVRILDAIDPADPDPTEPPWSGPGLAVRLVETEGRARPVRLRCFRSPTRARLRDARGRTVQELMLEGDAAYIPLRAYEIADVELRFG